MSFAMTSLAMSILLSMQTPAARAQPAGPSDAARIEAVNRAFLEHLRTAGPESALAAQSVRDAWERTYRDGPVESFVPDALAVLHADFRAALDALDAGRVHDAAERFGPLRAHPDPFVAANAAYFEARAWFELGDSERAAATLADLESRTESDRLHTPFAPHLWFLRAACQARVLEFEAAEASLAELRKRFPDAPEPVLVGARQLQLEVERRQTGTLDEVSTVMTFVADRLNVADPGDATRSRQEEVVALLDRLIEDQEQQEQQAGSGSARRGGQPSQQPGAPATPREESAAPEGSAEIGELHGAPRAAAAESWGNLPPAQREKILQSIRERFPSRYRELVEQYYRALAEDK